MAKDLLLGKSRRDWSAGISREESRLAYQDALAYRDVPGLAKSVEAETQRNFQEALRLDSLKKLPIADRRAFGLTLRKWQALRDSRQGKYTGEDFVALTNIRDENRQHSRKFAELASSPPSPQPENSSNPSPRDPPSMSWISILPLAAGAASLLLLSRTDRKT
jgi:hypothetical protein